MLLRILLPSDRPITQPQRGRHKKGKSNVVPDVLSILASNNTQDAEELEEVETFYE